ncbi:hypothetical protein BDQ17DRAFT_1289216 [Cyathus striatus]|nr:hypothetical protein BDQ17DRAFT_1289216 [Cyathus striatus]
MKRGFLNLNKQKFNRKVEVPQGSQQQETGFTNNTVNTPPPDLQILAFDPLHCNPYIGQPICTARTTELPLDINYASIHPSALVCTRVPSISADAYGTSECVLYSRTNLRLLNTPRFPRSPTLFDPLSAPYQIRGTESSGLGIFATHPLKIGDLILVERPLVVIAVKTDLSSVDECPEFVRIKTKEMEATNETLAGIVDPMLDIVFGRMSREKQDAYLALANIAAGDGTRKLPGIWQTNSFGFTYINGEGEDQYAAILKEMSRVNHSCRPNCCHRFDQDAFAFEIRATKAITCGEEIFYSYCDPGAPTNILQAQLSPYGFRCTCLSCVPTPTNPCNDTVRSSLLARTEALVALDVKFAKSRENDKTVALKIYEDSVALVRDMEQEGMDGYGWYCHAMIIRARICIHLARVAKSSSNNDEEVRWGQEAVRHKETALRLHLAADGSAKAGDYFWA